MDKVKLSRGVGKALMVALLAASPTPAQLSQAPVKAPTIFIGMELRLGMPKDVVISTLAATYKTLKLQGTGDDWFVQEKDDPPTTIGLLGFTDGRLTYAVRNWTQGYEDTFQFGQALHGAMAAIQREGHNSCLFDVSNNRSPTADMRDVRLSCGPKRIEVSTVEVLNGTGKGRYAYVKEILSSGKNR